MTRVIVPVPIVEGGDVSSGLMALLGTMDVTVLGYHVIPEQTAPEQAREQYGDRAQSALQDLSQEFRQAGGDADYRLVFTHDRKQTIDRVAEEINARAIAKTEPTGDLDRILVSLSSDVAVTRILSFVQELIGDRDIGVTLLSTAKQTDMIAELLNESATQLERAGIDVRTTMVRGSTFDAVINSLQDHDAIVIGEKATSLMSLIFGDESEWIAKASIGPVLVVRKDEDLDSA